MHLVASSLLLGLAAAANHRVDIGKGGLDFRPNTTTAAIGDTIDFHFYPKNHSVAMGAFASPCQPLTSGGFFSGYVPIADGESKVSFTIKVNSTDPIWFYCTQGKHCESGMVGVINPPLSSGDTLSAYAEAAKSAPSNVAPASEFGGEIKTATGTATKTHTGSGSSSATETGSATVTTGSTTATAASGTASASSTAKPGAAATMGVGREMGGLVAGVAIALAVL